MNLLYDLLKFGAKHVLEVKELKDKVIVDMRLETCNGCKFLTKKRSCIHCGCFVDVKATMEVNINPKTMRQEITHCPIGKWNDVEISNYYK